MYSTLTAPGISFHWLNRIDTWGSEREDWLRVWLKCLQLSNIPAEGSHLALLASTLLLRPLTVSSLFDTLLQSSAPLSVFHPLHLLVAPPPPPSHFQHSLVKRFLCLMDKAWVQTSPCGPPYQWPSLAEMSGSWLFLAALCLQSAFSLYFYLSIFLALSLSLTLNTQRTTVIIHAGIDI